ncbi:glycerophosphodiester phosphodiesterase [Pseudomonas sp. HMWF032]|uniref:glycerophosphodiester phosphodiesterase n=1 Tax=unclassified Pseudomonas TaxID=196821 RepID=UPI000D396D08|nr:MULTISPECIES: glycerophosphodiester phosphodiesterase [unclassified Pseudomonas]PTS83038.1 glycerophosphodiester phosphodiesterase [Pseudomonas sp. HMWF032]PTT82008.1 glycerophosphodiester phosphodiesterase [Pseudomonas sp. HMWF010]WAC45089.1 glycerophosphodiester phosphodiesterase [Pseudomonas sp. SL4(2022)]
MLRIIRFISIPLMLLAIALGVLALTSTPATPPAVVSTLGEQPLVIAHRGGKGLWPENSLFAFERAKDLGVDMLEMDLHLSSDGELVVIHDRTLDRTTNGEGPVAALSLAQLQALDAGYRWSADGGQSYPYRGQGIRIPRFAEVLQRFPETPKVIEIKVPDVGMETHVCEALTKHQQRDKVIVGSFYDRSLQLFREQCPGVATSAGPGSVRLLVALNWVGLGSLLSPSYQALQIPESYEGLPMATPSLFKTASERGLNVQLWTINEQPDMRRLLDLGANALITDYPDRALQVLGRSTGISAAQAD